MKEIKLSKGFTALVDDEDYDRLNQFHWYLSTHGYAYRDSYTKGHRIKDRYFMHRELMGFPDGYLIDHIDQNPLNNQKMNLRLATKSDNAKNAKSHKDSKCKYKGVSPINKSYSRIAKSTGELRHYIYPDWYQAQICFNGKKINIGTFKTPEEAALAYDIKAIELFGEFASLNFPNMSGISMRELMDQLRHTRLTATEHYLRLRSGTINERIRDNFPNPI